ncbi:hypothetical protein KSP40_PGU014101 [Platanthera guangdongensis]|uniref:3'-5' exonuclease domain-containing protein n=1 Tax=Platanthera guangdongensis TaxID=2320717 RepID=A0ABR2MSM3_9ASPA
MCWNAQEASAERSKEEDGAPGGCQSLVGREEAPTCTCDRFRVVRGYRRGRNGKHSNDKGIGREEEEVGGKLSGEVMRLACGEDTGMASSTGENYSKGILQVVLLPAQGRVKEQKESGVSRIDVKQETPVDHGEIICFSIYSGPQAKFGNGKSYIWVDVMDGGHDVLMEFAPFFEDPKIKKVWHNYSFDSHIIESHGIKLSGFYADTMHLARLWDSSRKLNGGYSLEALTSDPIVMSRKKSRHVDKFMGKISMKSIFGKRNVKKDGSEGKSITMVPVELIQREELIPWICYSVLDSISTLRLFESLKEKLEAMDWVFEGTRKGSMYKFYEEYWRPFGNLLVNMEAEGLLVDRAYLSYVQKIAIAEQQLAADRFRRWASTYCPDAKYMNVGSDTQTRQLFFGGISNRYKFLDIGTVELSLHLMIRSKTLLPDVLVYVHHIGVLKVL